MPDIRQLMGHLQVPNSSRASVQAIVQKEISLAFHSSDFVDPIIDDPISSI